MKITTNIVTVSISGGQSNIQVPWSADMTAEQALQAAYDSIGDNDQFSYALQYFGSGVGNLVVMINGLYESFANSVSGPSFSWAFTVNGVDAIVGVDLTLLAPNDDLGFAFVQYEPGTLPATSTIWHKHRARS